MEQKQLFNESVIFYDKHRPTYGKEIYKDIIEYSKLDILEKDKFAIEIGCGTGQATKPFLDIGCIVDAVEIGEDLSKFTRAKYANYKNLNVINMPFEDFKVQDNTIDLVYSATAFHWIKKDIAYNKVLNMLKNNGCLATWWNTPRVSEENLELKTETDKIYEKYMNEIYSSTDDISYKKRCERIQDEFRQYGYKDISFNLYYEYRTFTADTYIELLHTYSDHMILENNIRIAFFNEIHNAISKHKIIKIKDTIDLHMGRK